MSQVYKIGSVPNPAGMSVFYCNGANTPQRVVEADARVISMALGHRILTVFYNPTRLGKDPTTVRLDKVAKQFYQIIAHETQLSKATEKTALRIVLFLHSQGATIAMLAISHMDQSEKEALEIYTFGPSMIIPDRIGKRVINFVYENDYICEVTNKVQNNFILTDFKSIREKKMQGIHPFVTIFSKARDDLFTHLSPYRKGYDSESEEVKKDKDNRYHELFLNPAADLQALLDDPFFEERRQYYLSIICDYTIVILPGLPSYPIEANSFEDFCCTSLKEVVTNGYKSHPFEVYQAALNHKEIRELGYTRSSL